MDHVQVRAPKQLGRGACLPELVRARSFLPRGLYSQGTETMRLLTLCSLAAASPVLSYDAVAKALQVRGCAFVRLFFAVRVFFVGARDKTLCWRNLSPKIIEITLLDALPPVCVRVQCVRPTAFTPLR